MPYAVLQAALFVPSSGMRALRRAHKDGKDLQAEALAALIPSIGSQIRSGGRRNPNGVGGVGFSPIGFGRGFGQSINLSAERDAVDRSLQEEREAWRELRDRLGALAPFIEGEQDLLQAEAESASLTGFSALFRGQTEGAEARQLRAVVSAGVHDLSDLVRETREDPLRAREELPVEVLSRLEELEGEPSSRSILTCTYHIHNGPLHRAHSHLAHSLLAGAHFVHFHHAVCAQHSSIQHR